MTLAASKIKFRLLPRTNFFGKIKCDSPRGVQPILWLGIFDEALSKVRAIPTQGFTYLQFITPGILTQSVVFVAIFYGLYISAWMYPKVVI